MTAIDDSRGAGRLRVPLAAKLTVALSAAALVMLGFLLGYHGPNTTRGFLQRSEELIAESTGMMRDMAEESAADSRAVLVDVIHHTADARRRVLADLPLSLYGGDIARIRAAIATQDAAKSSRLRENVDVLAGEMTRRYLVRIDRYLETLSAAQRTRGVRFADELRGSFLWLSAVVLFALILVLGGALYRVVVRPLRRLQEASRAVARGDLSVAIEPGASDEVGALAADFGAMVEQLRGSRDEIERQHQELTRWNEKLGVEVARKTDHLERALADLRRTQRQLVHAAKMSALGTLAGGVAHEFNNLIGGIRGCAADAMETETSGERREPLEVIVRAADRATGIVAQLLDFARQRVGAWEAVDLATVIGDALRLVEPDARRGGIELTTQIADGLEVEGDGSALHQVFLNLLTNALQAMPDGGRLRVEASVRGDEVVVRVSDSGIGISAEQIDHVFDPFFTTRDQDPDPARRGSGLGLSVWYGIVEAHGGALTVESETGDGAVFTVRIPGAKRPDNRQESS